MAGAVLAVPERASALSTDVVISAVYGGGGNSGATFRNDFIELANLSDAPISVSGWSVQYASASGAFSNVTLLGGTIPAHGRFLIQENAGAGGTLDLPTPDVLGSISMSASSGVVALVTAPTALGACSPACATAPGVKDLVGYGNTQNVETAAAPQLSNTTADARTGTLVDTDDNSADFTAGVPSATNSAGVTVTVGDPGGGGDPTPGPLRIHDLQGAGRLSPVAGDTVTNVPGVVTAVRASGSRGFWIQDPDADADPLTSEGVFVYTGSAAPTVSVGDSVLVSGRVSEYRPTSGGQTLTEITSPAVTTIATGQALPAAVPVVLPADYTKSGALETEPLEPAAYALDWLEVHEGMRVTLADDLRLVAPVNTQYDEIWVTTRPDQNPTPRGGTVYGSYDDPNSGRLMIVAPDDVDGADVGSILAAGTTGTIDYQSFGGYVLAATEVGAITPADLPRQRVLPKTRKKDVAVATYNVENLDPGDPQEKFDELAAGIVDSLGSPDILALEEVQDNTGPTNDGVVAADETMARLIAAVSAAGGPWYDWRGVDPSDGEDGGQPGGNIRQVFLFNPATVGFVDRPGGDADTAVEVVDGQGDAVSLSVSPGRIEPTDVAWEESRKPLVGEFTYGNDTLFVVANHFNSKGGDYPLSAAVQPPVRGSEVQRLQQATLVRDFVAELADESAGTAKVVVLGDLNDYQFSPVLQTVTDDGQLLRNLWDTLPADERYSYVFDGNSQVLDHILVSPAIRYVQYGVVHINAEYSDQASDHDPQVLRILHGCEGNTHAERCQTSDPVVDVD
ncbi:hypothetical protein E8D34_13700 [Nocardioides sp. GY 10113]|nr:hypothetical protein E8D34_13700 [Nocardioides sp. GY 10113]